MAQEMDNGIKSVASSKLLQVRNSQMMLPSDVYAVTSWMALENRSHSDTWSCTTKTTSSIFSSKSRKNKTKNKQVEVVTGN